MKFANQLFEEEKYAEAYNHYLQLLPSYRTDPDMNFRYGTCLLHVTENKSEALPYLNFAVSKNADPRALFFLGKTYHLLYKFATAEQYYKQFQVKGTPTDKEKYQVDMHVRMCLSGKKLLSNLTELVVEQKTETKFEKFPYSYDLSQMGGRIIISEEFQSKIDIKRGYRSMTYIPPLNQGNDVIFYASYGKDGSTGLDLYAKKRLPNGDWGEEQKLPDHINTPYDDAYGFLHSSKTVFYFCSKGHNSMGGYDIFRCSYDISTNTFGPPENMDYKINTPDDDIMYVVDSLEQNAYFASGRATKYGYIDVYKVRVETFPLVNVMLAGKFDNKINASENATIKIQDTKDEEIIGIYNPKQDGKYMIILPRSGTYTFIVETPSSEKIHQSQVVIPPQKEFKPLKQKIILTNENGLEKLIIQNLFDEEFSTEELEGFLAEAMQMMADPEVNADKFENVISSEEQDSILSNNQNWKLEDIESMAKGFYEDAQEEADKLKDKMDAAFAVANQKSKDAAENAAESESILNSLDQIDNPLERQQQADLAEELNNKAKDEYLQATTAFNLANGLKDDYERAQEEANESKQTYESIQSTINEKDHDKAITQLTELRTRIEEIINNNPEDNAADGILEMAQRKKNEANKAFTDAKEFRAEEDKLNLRLNNLKGDLDKAKEKDKQAIQVQIDELVEQIAMNKKWADEAFAKGEELDKDAASLSHQAQLLLDLDSDLANSNKTLSEEEKSQLEKWMNSNDVQSGINKNENALNNFSGSDSGSNNNGNVTASNNETNNTNSGTNNGTVNSNGSNNTSNNGGNNGGNETTSNNGTNNTNSGTNNGNVNNNGSNNTSNNGGNNNGNETASNNGSNNANSGTNNGNVNNNGSNNTSNNGGNNSGNETASNNETNNTNSATNNGSINSSEFTAQGLVDEAAVIVNQDELQKVRNNPNLSAEEKLEKENEILQEWFDKYDVKIVEANKGLLETSDPLEREKFMEARRTFEKEQLDIEDQITRNNNTLDNGNLTTSNSNYTEEYRNLQSETQEKTSKPDDFSGDLTEQNPYLSDDAATELEKLNDQQASLKIKEDELVQLESDLEKETKDKKKDKIQSEIDQKQDEILDLKENIGGAIFSVDSKELEYNDERMSDLIEQVKTDKENYKNDANYLKAEIYNSTAEDQRTLATEKLEAAEKTTDKEKRAKLLEEAHALNLSAIDNQKEAIGLLEEITEDNYVAEIVQVNNGDDPLAQNKSGTNNGGNNSGNETASNNGTSNTNSGTNNGTVNNNGSNNTSNNGGNNSGNETASNNGTSNTNSGTNNGNVNNNGSNNTSNNGGNNSGNETASNNGTSNTNSGTNNGNVNNNGSNNTSNNGGNNSGNETTSNNGTSNTNSGTNNVNVNTNGSNNTSNNGGNNSGNETASNNGTNNTNSGTNNGSVNNNTSNNTNVGTNAGSNNSGNTTLNNNNSTVAKNSIEAVNNGTNSISNVTEYVAIQSMNNVPDQKVNDKTYESTTTNPDAYDIAEKVDPITYSNKSSEFNSEAADQIFANNEKVVEKIDELVKEKTALNVEAQNAQTDKEREKLENKVKTIDDKIEKQESKLHDDVAEIAEAKLNASKNNLEIVKESFGDLLLEESTNKKQSEAFESKGKELELEADRLREEAQNTKNKDSQSELLKEANSKELKAVEYYDMAANLYVDAAFGNTSKQVAKNESPMSSEEMKAKADELSDRSYQLKQESLEHRDSALLAKGDDKIQMIQRAEEKEKMANTLASISSGYKDQANEVAVREQEEANKENLLADLSPKDVEEVKSLPEYEKYYDLNNQKNELLVEKAKLDGEKNGVQNILLQQNQELKQLENEKLDAKDKAEQNRIQSEIETLEDAIIANEDKVDFLNESIEAIEEKISAIDDQKDNSITSLNSTQQNDIKALELSDYDKNPIKKSTITFGDLIASNFVVPEKIDSDLIAMDTSIKYSDANPIPMNVKYPNGLIYKVQVGAFSKPIPNDIFSGFAPITGEQVGTGDLVRYRVGYFVNYNNANDAKNEIRGFGYSDAFVVAIYNGERITIAEARSIEQNGATNLASNGNNANNVTNNQNTTGTDVVSNKTTVTPEDIVKANSTEIEVDLGNGAAKTNNADKIEGLFYTVQLGAFSKPIQATDVYNISPLVTKFVGNLYKYSTGIYRSVDDAVVRKNEVVALGNADAFVTVYYNGEKISTAKARELIAEFGEGVYATDASGVLKQLNGSSGGAQNIVTNESGEYFVDLGTYSGEVPTELANAMLMIPQYEVKTVKNGSSENYYVGYFTKASDAQKVLELYKENGIENLEVVNKNSTSIGPKPFNGIVYRVYLGTYEGEVPSSRAMTFVELKDEGIDKEVSNGKETYYAGKKSLYSEAQTVLKKFTSRGVSIAEIKAFKDGQEIPVEEAKQLTREQ
ncbi:MAG: hypothetical protein H6598_01865 [Flavobacteriales bacterium]|nr:hypothetical protein [Flavobacteriales bacterium]